MIELSVYNRMIRRRDILKAARTPYETDWKEIAQNLYPRREFLNLKPTEGTRVGTHIYDTAVVDYFNKESYGFQGYIVSASIDWFDMAFVIDELNRNKEAREWLDIVVERLYERFRDSNFYDAIHDYIRNGLSFATATMYCENYPEERTINYENYHPISIIISEDRRGVVDTTIREFELPAYEAVQFFGEQNLSEQVTNDTWKVETMDNKHKFLHFVFKRNDDFYKPTTVPAAMPWVSVYIEAEHPKDEERVAREKGYYENPYATWRYDKVSPYFYGRGPAHDALPDIVLLNDFAKAAATMIQKQANPAILAPAEHLGRLRTGPGGINYYENLANEQIKVINDTGNYSSVKDYIQDKRENVKNLLMVDFFLMLASADRTKTAYEVSELKGEKAAVMGTAVGRFESECLDPLINRTFRIEYENGRLPPMPGIVRQYGGEGIKIDYTGPLARIQKQLFKSNPITHSLAALGNLMEVFPGVGDLINSDEAGRVLLNAYNAPQKIIRDEEEVRAIREAKAKAQEEQMKMVQAKEAADMVEKLGKKVEPGSPVEALIAGNK